MSRILYLGCFSGISGNMALGAFVDAGCSEFAKLVLVKTGSGCREHNATAAIKKSGTEPSRPR